MIGTAASAGRTRRVWALAGGLVAAVAFAFQPALANGFADPDDTANFTENLDYRGFGWAQVCWAWTTTLVGVYQPLSWMAFSAESAVWGLDPRGYHRTSLALYAVDTLILFALTRAVLARCTPSPEGRNEALVATALAVATFAVHPLRTEVVAWASCQPYLGCAGFAMLTVLAYLRAFDEGRRAASRRGLLVLAVVLYSSSLLCKAASASLPLVLLVLDAYPLRRFGDQPHRRAGAQARRVGLEKVPFLVLAALFMGIAVRFRFNEPIAEGFTRISSRVAHALFSIGFYPLKTVVPHNLSAYYAMPSPLRPTDPAVLASAVAVAGISLILYRDRARRPGLLASWACYLAILAPVSGLVHAGPNLAADRYSFLATMAWVPPAAAGLGLLVRRGWIEPLALGMAGLVALAGLAGLSRAQCRTWTDQETLARHALGHGAAHSARAHLALGVPLLRKGRGHEALDHLLEAVRLDPTDPIAHGDAGACLSALGRFEEAESHCAFAAEHRPRSDGYWLNYARVLIAVGKFDRAIAHLDDLVREAPESAAGHYHLGRALARSGRVEEALHHTTVARRLDPQVADARLDLEPADRGGASAATAPAADPARSDRPLDHAVVSPRGRRR